MQIQSNDEIQKFLPVNSPDQFFHPGGNPEGGIMEGHHLAKVGQVAHARCALSWDRNLKQEGKMSPFW